MQVSVSEIMLLRDYFSIFRKFPSRKQKDDFSPLFPGMSVNVAVLQTAVQKNRLIFKKSGGSVLLANWKFSLCRLL